MQRLAHDVDALNNTISGLKIGVIRAVDMNGALNEILSGNWEPLNASPAGPG
jgi:hypothetical protein